ncbi:MAG: RsmE family RNA methyltransferase [Actinomycetota bacterium]
MIEGPDARHLAVVRRAGSGDAIRVSDGRGRLIEARITSATPSRVEAAVAGDRHVPAPSPRVAVFLGLARGQKVDVVVRQLVELGVDALTVFQAGRSVARWDAGKASAARFRWAVIAREAAKQSHRAWLPDIIGPLPSAAATASALAQAQAATGGSAAFGLVAHPAAAVPVREALESIPARVGQVWLAIGPEGGLADDEVASFVAAGATSVTLGPQILRAETAPIVLASLVLFRLGRFDG